METPLPTPESQPDMPPPAQMSLAGRLMNIFAAPTEVFDDIKGAAPALANWLAPALILILLSLVTGWLIMSRESIQQQLREITSQAIERQVAQGKLSEQQAEQARVMGEKWAGIGVKVSMSVYPVFVAFGGLFIWAGFLWLVGAVVWKADFTYMKAVEVVGLSNMVGVLEVLVKTLLILALGNLYAAPSLVLLVKQFDPQNTLHALLALGNVMTLWILGVRAAGLARLTGRSFGKAAIWVYGIWLGYTGLFIGLGALMQAVFKRISG